MPAYVVHKTRFSELGYWMIEPGCWSIVDISDGKPSQVGQKYPTEQSLLENLESYATEFGCELATPVKRLGVTSNEAELILYLLAIRSRQKTISIEAQRDAVELGKRLDAQFANEFGWDKTIDRIAHTRRLVKTMSVKGFDLPPND